ncbi:acylneuraminate cytidylyltransferase family protein [Candidatus Thioglobus sp.]|nr:acylneuraminate cytidylyltransferase family protein [Candidatus Thioglobus sp.]
MKIPPKLNNIVALIPARSGSKGVPNKNIRHLDGIPLIAYSIATALKSTLIDRVIVSTDSEEYAEIAKNYGAETPFIRPKSISGDTATDVECFKHTIDWLRENENFVPEYFVHLRPTTPFRDPKVLDKAIKDFVCSDYSALRSCHKMSESSYKTFEIENDMFKCVCNGSSDIESSNIARQAFPETYDANGYIDIVRSEMISKKNLIHGSKVRALITKTAYEVDEISDIDFLEYLIQKNPEYKHIFK